MKLKIKFLNLLSLIGIMISLTGCHSCDREEEVVIVGAIACTSDLLEFVTPIVIIQGDNGKKESFRLTMEDFQNLNSKDELEMFPPVITTVDKADNICVAAAKMKFKDVKAMKGTITVKYEPNINADNNKDKLIYFFGSELGYSYLITGADLVSISQTGSPINMMNVYTLHKDEVEKYISDLCATEKSISFDVK